MTDEPRLWAPLTPSGIRIDLVSCFARIAALLREGSVDDALDYADTFRDILAATALGQYEVIEKSYEKALIKNFEKELADDEALAKLLKEDESE